MKWNAEKWLFLVFFFSDLKNNKNSRSYRCSNKAKNRVFRTFRLGLLKNLTCWSSSEAGFGFYGKNYFWNNLSFLEQIQHFFCRSVLSDKIFNGQIVVGQYFYGLRKLLFGKKQTRKYATFKLIEVVIVPKISSL